MTPSTVMELAYRSMRVMLMIGAPTLIAALSVGLLVGLFQAATQINEMTLSYIPKIIAVVITLSVGGPWLLTQIIEFTRHLIINIPNLIG